MTEMLEKKFVTGRYGGFLHEQYNHQLATSLLAAYDATVTGRLTCGACFASPCHGEESEPARPIAAAEPGTSFFGNGVPCVGVSNFLLRIFFHM
jgi:hypothetical protein